MHVKDIKAKTEMHYCYGVTPPPPSYGPVLNEMYSGTGLESTMLRTFFINCWKFMLHKTK